MSVETIIYRHPSLGFEIELPRHSELVEDAPGAALVAAEPEDPEAAFRANIVVTTEPGSEHRDVDAYTDASLAVQAQVLDAFVLIDRVRERLRGGEALRTLGHHDVGGMAVTIEQWRLLSAGRAYTLTASCWTLDYDSLADSFASAAETFVP